MDIERETVMEIGASLLPVIAFMVLLIYLGSSYSSNGDLTATGGLVVVGLLVLFVLATVGIGYWLAHAEHEE